METCRLSDLSRRLLGILLILIFLACSESAPIISPDPEQEVPFEEFAVTLGACREESGIEVARTPEEAWELWNEVCAVGDLSEIDFDEEMIVAYFMRVQSTSGFYPEVQRITARRGTTTVYVVEHSPGALCRVLSASTRPAVVIRMKERDGEIESVVRKQIDDCS